MEMFSGQNYLDWLAWFFLYGSMFMLYYHWYLLKKIPSAYLSGPILLLIGVTFQAGLAQFPELRGLLLLGVVIKMSICIKFTGFLIFVGWLIIARSIFRLSRTRR